MSQLWHALQNSSAVGGRGYLACLCVLGHHGRPVLRKGDVGLDPGSPPIESDLR